MGAEHEVTTGLTLVIEIARRVLKAPFRITGYTLEFIDVLLLSLKKDGAVGRGEACGVYYKGDTATSMMQSIESVRVQIESAISRDLVQTLLPPGGARNALDCALWDLHAKLMDCPAWRSAGVERPRPLITTFTCDAGAPEEMARTALRYKDARAIKLKLTGEPIDADRVRAVRDSLPNIWIGVDANQGFTRNSLERLMPTLTAAGVQLVEQPLPVGQEALLDGFKSPIPLAADESVQSLGDVAALVGRFDVVNIKLDKCGGLTEGLAMNRAARELGLKTMVGNMLGSSLAMAPGFVLGQICDVVDLDGPLFLREDWSVTARYVDGHIECPDRIWGASGQIGAAR